MSPAIDSPQGREEFAVREATMLGTSQNRLIKPEPEPRPDHRRREQRARLLPWALVAGVVVAALIAGAVMMGSRGRVMDELAIARADADAAGARAATATHHMDNLAADLAALRGEIDQAKKRAEEAEKKAAEADELAVKLETLTQGRGKVVRQGQDRITLELVDKVLFRSGEAKLTRRGEQVLEQVGAALNRFPDKQIWVQGHTDDVPLTQQNPLFASNWELSAARALTVVHYLQDQAKVDPRRLAAVAFGQHRPVSRRSKAKNRRIEIVLLPQEIAVSAKP